MSREKNGRMDLCPTGHLGKEITHLVRGPGAYLQVPERGSSTGRVFADHALMGSESVPVRNLCPSTRGVPEAGRGPGLPLRGPCTPPARAEASSKPCKLPSGAHCPSVALRQVPLSSNELVSSMNKTVKACCRRCHMLLTVSLRLPGGVGDVFPSSPR